MRLVAMELHQRLVRLAHPENLAQVTVGAQAEVIQVLVLAEQVEQVVLLQVEEELEVRLGQAQQEQEEQEPEGSAVSTLFEVK